MGTRADFYIGRSKSAEWLGSIGWDGYWDGIDAQILQCTSESAFRHAVASFIARREDGTKPEDGWPWPWETSALTDCVYAFDGGSVWQNCDERWVDGTKECDWDNMPADAQPSDWPDMTARKNVTMGPRSGCIVIVG